MAIKLTVDGKQVTVDPKDLSTIDAAAQESIAGRFDIMALASKANADDLRLLLTIGERARDLAAEQNKAASAASHALKVGPKGTVQVTGFNGKYGISLYGGQWAELLDMTDKIRGFIAENADHLSTKDAAGRPQPPRKPLGNFDPVAFAQK